MDSSGESDKNLSVSTKIKQQLFELNEGGTYPVQQP